MRRILVLPPTIAGACLLFSATLAAQTVTVQQSLWKQCREDVISLQADPEPFEEVIGTEFTLRLDNGRALVAILVQDCPEWSIDGEDIGPSEEVHMWVALQGPEDLRPLAGVEETLPTMTWFNVFDGAQNPRVREAFGASGTISQPIDDLELDPGSDQLGGTVSVGQGLRYGWSAAPNTPFAQLIGVNHDIYGRDSNGEVLLNQVQAILDVSAWASDGMMTVAGGTDPRGLIGDGTYPVRVNRITRLWAWASLGKRPTR